jgi:hypothetical protein
MSSEDEYWIDGKGIEHHISNLENDHLINIYNLLLKRKEKDMQFINIRNEIRKRKLLNI